LVLVSLPLFACPRALADSIAVGRFHTVLDGQCSLGRSTDERLRAK